jgi:hypothetical protein
MLALTLPPFNLQVQGNFVHTHKHTHTRSRIAHHISQSLSQFICGFHLHAQDKFKDLIFPENTRVDIYETGSSTYNFTAKEIAVESAEQLLGILADAERERKTSKTNMNAG